MSGFFLIRRAALDLTDLNPRGFKILLEMLVRGGPLSTAEIPFRFGERHAGESKASLREGARYLHRLIELRFGVSREPVLHVQPEATQAGAANRGRFKYEDPAVWNGNGTAVGEHAPKRTVLT